jgi:general secretion pathway protein G
MKGYKLRATRCELEPQDPTRYRFRETRCAKLADGFTLIEMVIVISIVLVLLAIALPMYERAITRSREATFKHNLHTLNSVINQYSLNKRRAPQSLDDLVPDYLKVIPNDITGKNDTWKTDPEDPQNCMDPNQCGISGVHSGSDATSSDGSAYSSWTL